MTAKKMVMLAALVLLFGFASANAITLGQLHLSHGGGTYGIANALEFTWHAYPNESPHGWITWVLSPEDIGQTFTASATTDIGFENLVLALTNGQPNDWMPYEHKLVPDSGSGGVYGGEEGDIEQLVGNGCDFIGYTIDNITLTLNDCVLDVPGINPNGDGIWTDWTYDVTININGVPQSVTIFVDAAASGTNNGSSWADAFNYLQDALAVAECGDEIWVVAGTYKPGTVRTSTFQLKNCVALYGGFAGGETNLDERDWETNETILSGDLNGNDAEVTDPANLLNELSRSDNSYHVVKGSGTDTTARLDGFTITGGYANHRTYPNDHGAGMFNESGSPKVINCVFIANTAYASIGSGAGMFNGFSSSPTVINCSFTGNACYFNGGGMANDNRSSPELTNCVFSGNYAGNHGAGIANYSSCRPEITNCTFSGNKARRCGGGISNYGSCYPSLANCIFWSNTAPIKPQIQDLAGSHTTVEYSDIQGGWSGEGNIDDDPRFVDPDGPDDCAGTEDDNLHLLPWSPCIDAGFGDNGVTVPMTDMEGNPRVDCPTVENTGAGEPNYVDMGAYEANYIQAQMKFTPQALNPGSQGNWVKAHLVLPEGFMENNVDANTSAMLYPGGIPSEVPMNVFINEDGLVEVEAAFSRADFCSNGPTEGTVTVVGLLSSGQSFYGTDTIRIITHNLEYVAVFASHWLEANCGKPDWCSGIDLDQNSVVDFVDFAMFDGCCIEIIK